MTPLVPPEGFSGAEGHELRGNAEVMSSDHRPVSPPRPSETEFASYAVNASRARREHPYLSEVLQLGLESPEVPLSVARRHVDLTQEQLDLGESSQRLAQFQFDPDLLRPELYTNDERCEIEGRLALLLSATENDYHLLSEQVRQVLDQLHQEHTRLSKNRASVNATNVDHLIDEFRKHLEGVNSAVAAQQFSRFLRLAAYASEEELRAQRVLTLEEYDIIVDAYWQTLGEATAIYDLGKSIYRYGYGAGQRAGQLGRAGFSPRAGYRLFRDQVPKFNTNKTFEVRPTLRGKFSSVPRDWEEEVIDMWNFPGVNSSSDIQSRLYIQGILESIICGYGLAGGYVEPLILEQPVTVYIDYLRRMQERGVRGIPELGDCVLNSGNGQLCIGAHVYGEAIQAVEGWENLGNWDELPREQREEKLRLGDCLIRIMQDLVLDRPEGVDNTYPVYIFKKGGIVAFHRLPISRFRMVYQKVDFWHHIAKTALPTQLKLIWEDIKAGRLLNSLPRLAIDFRALAKQREQAMADDARAWIEEQKREIARLQVQLDDLTVRNQGGELTLVQKIELVKNIIALIGVVHSETAAHIERVTETTIQLAQRLALSYPEFQDPLELEKLRNAGLLHDVGKVAVPMAVVTSTEKFSSREAFLMQSHALYTQRILEYLGQTSDPFFHDVAFLAATHHEKLNGTGYPHGLKGEQIPTGAQIMAVADIYDALSEKRAYQARAKPRPVVFKILTDSVLKGELNPYALEVLFALKAEETSLNEEEQSYLSELRQFIKENA